MKRGWKVCSHRDFLTKIAACREIFDRLEASRYITSASWCVLLRKEAKELQLPLGIFVRRSIRLSTCTSARLHVREPRLLPGKIEGRVRSWTSRALRKISARRDAWKRRRHGSGWIALNAVAIKTEAKCFDIYRLALWPVVPRMAAEWRRGRYTRQPVAGDIFWRGANENGSENGFAKEHPKA